MNTVDACDDRKVEAVGHNVSDVRRQVGKQFYCRQAFEPVCVQFWVQGQDFEDVLPVAVLSQRHEPWFHRTDQFHDPAPELDRLGVPILSRIERVGDMFDDRFREYKVVRVACQAVQDESLLLVDIQERILRKGFETAFHIGCEADAGNAVVLVISPVPGHPRLEFPNQRVLDIRRDMI